MFARSLVASAILACSTAVALAAPPTQVAVTSCGQVIPRFAVGYLTGDLDCTGYDGLPGAVMVSRQATFELRGFRLTGGLLTVLCGEMRNDRFGEPQLHIDHRCTVSGGGGTIAGAEAHGISGYDLNVSDLTVENAGQEGIYSVRNAHISNVTVTGSGGIGMRIDRTATVVDSHVSGSGEIGVAGLHVLKISGSTVVGNGTGPNCPYPWSCVDLFSGHRPKVVDTQCNTSGGSGYRNWGVCAAD